jgi:phosphonate transport system substrate-binding protein
MSQYTKRPGRRVLTCWLVGILLVLTACGGERADGDETVAPAATEGAGVIVLADIDADDPVAKVEEFQPLVNYLAANLNSFGIGVGEVKVAPDLETLITWMENGEVDIFYDSPYPAMSVNQATGAQPLLRGWRGGEPVYHTLFFTRSDTGITTLADLAGRVIAYEEESSTSGFMMPTAYLVANGFNPVELAAPDSTVNANEIGYTFSGDDRNTIEWVLNGRVDVGVIDNLTYLSDIPEETKAQLVIVAETEDIARRVLMIRPGMDPELVVAIKSVFIELENNPEGQAILEKLNTTRFDEFPEGAEVTLEQMRELYELIR